MTNQPNLQDTVDAAAEFLRMATVAREAGQIPRPEQMSDFIDLGTDLLGVVEKQAERYELLMHQFSQLMALAKAGRIELAETRSKTRKEDAKLAEQFLHAVGVPVDAIADLTSLILTQNKTP